MEHEHRKEESVSLYRPFEEPETAEGKQERRTIRAGVMLIALAIIGIGVIAYYGKGIVVAATVDGRPISRLAVIEELERSAGQKTLNSLIDERLIKAEIAKHDLAVTDAEVEEEIKRIEMQVTGKEGALDEFLATQGVTRDELKDRITVQKQIEKLLGEKVAVTDAEVEAYITSNAIKIPQGQEEQYRNQIRQQLRAQKFSEEAQRWAADLRANASIRYFVDY